MTSFQARRFGKYLLLDRVAVGGMAELYRAKIIGDQGFEKIVAIKKILPHLTVDETLIRLFIDEAKIAAFLQHHNIVQIYDFGTMDNSYFIAMEFLTGKDLRLTTNKAREKKTPLRLETALYITAQICEGLDFAHRLSDFQGKPLGIIHRDISPPNILITYTGQVKIIDFGIAKARNQSKDTQVGIIKGKVAYMSPEQADGKAIDNRSDIFATGILLYEMLAHRRMFSGEDTIQVLSQVRNARFTPPEKVIDCKHPELFEILHRALAKDPDQRYSSSAQMLTDIEKLFKKLPERPTSQHISRYMHNLFGEEIEAEALEMRAAMQVDIPVEPPTDIAAGLEADNTEPDTAFLTTEVVQLESRADGTQAARSDRPEKTGKIKKTSVYAGAAVALFVLAGVFFLLRENYYSGSREAVGDRIQAGISMLEEKRFSQAAELFESVLSEQPSLKEKVMAPYSRALLGQAAEIVGTSPEKAETLLLKAVRLNPENTEGLFRLGLFYVKQEQYKRAIAAFNKAVELDPQHPNTYYNLGYIYAKTRDYHKAEEMFERTVALKPPFLDEALFNLAIVQRKLGKKEQFIKTLELALEVNPNNKPAKEYLKRVRRINRLK